MRKLVLMFTWLFCFAAFMNAQTRQITGTVYSAEDGGTLPGVTVQVKGTTLGSITDVNGYFSLQVPSNATTLFFSFVGMVGVEVDITNTDKVEVQLQSGALDLSELVVTALGVSREKKSLGYASQGVKSEDIMSSNNTNPLTALSGRVAGMTVAGQNFAGSQNIMIRGGSSFSNSNQPLFVVDGVPLSNENFNDVNTQIGGGGYDYGSMINDLNSYDIESVDVLKGSAASALYGSRGQNGVVMITTKSGKAGMNTFSVEVNSGLNFEQVSILPKMQTSYGGGSGDFRKVTIAGKEYEVVGYAIDESWGPKYDANRQVLHWWGAADYEKGITSTPVTGPWVAPKNDVDAFYETGITYQNSLSVTSTSKNSAIRVGYTNANRTGIVPNSSQNKHNFNLNTQVSLFKDLVDLDANMNFIRTDTKGRPQFGYGDNSQSQKFFQWGQRQLDMERLKNYKNPDGTQRTWNRRSATNGTPVYSDNPYWTAYENYQDDDRTRVYGKFSGAINVTNYLKAIGTLYYDTYTFNQRERVAVGSQATSGYTEINRQATETNLEGKLQFKKSIDKLNILAFVGANSRVENYTRLEGSTSGGLVIAGLYNLNNSANQPTLDDFLRQKRVNSVFGSVSLGWNNLVYLDISERFDFDSSLPTGENSYDYPAVSLAFIASELIDLDIMDNLKVRGGYGVTSQGTDPYRVFNVYAIGQPFNGSPQFTNTTTLNNQHLRPETTSELEFGLEGSFLQKRVGFDLSLYDRNTKDQIVPIEVTGASGYRSRVINAGLINNRGIELTLLGTPVKTRDFSWDIAVNYAKNINTVKELPEGLDKIQIARAPFGGAYINSVEGKTFQEIYAYDFIYDSEGNKVIDETGFYATTGELTPIGSVLPDFTAGIQNSFRYRRFDANALIDASIGGNYYSITHMWGMYSGMTEESAAPTSNGNTIREDGIVLDGVTGDVTYNDDGTYTVSNTAKNTQNISAIDNSQLYYHGYGTPSATSIFDASYIKLREVSVGYTLPKLFDDVKSIRVSVYGRNLAALGLDNKGIDPETVVGGSGNIQGLEGGIVPATRSFGFNIKFNF